MSGRRSAPSLPNCGDEHEHEQEQEKRMMSYILFFIATVLAGTINAFAGGGGLITFPLHNAGRNAGNCRRHKRGRSVLCVSHCCVAHPGPVGRCPWSWMVMAASDSKCARRFDRSSAAKPDGQSQLYSVSAVVGVSGHYHHCAAADPGSTR